MSASQTTSAPNVINTAEFGRFLKEQTDLLDQAKATKDEGTVGGVLASKARIDAQIPIPAGTIPDEDALLEQILSGVDPAEARQAAASQEVENAFVAQYGPSAIPAPAIPAPAGDAPQGDALAASAEAADKLDGADAGALSESEQAKLLEDIFGTAAGGDHALSEMDNAALASLFGAAGLSESDGFSADELAVLNEAESEGLDALSMLFEDEDTAANLDKLADLSDSAQAAPAPALPAPGGDAAIPPAAAAAEGAPAPAADAGTVPPPVPAPAADAGEQKPVTEDEEIDASLNEIPSMGDYPEGDAGGPLIADAVIDDGSGEFASEGGEPLDEDEELASLNAAPEETASDEDIAAADAETNAETEKLQESLRILVGGSKPLTEGAKTQAAQPKPLQEGGLSARDAAEQVALSRLLRELGGGVEG